MEFKITDGVKTEIRQKLDRNYPVSEQLSNLKTARMSRTRRKELAKLNFNLKEKRKRD